MGAVQRMDGFTRYALAIQYNGASFFGFVRQPRQKASMASNVTNADAFPTVEGFIRDALSKLVGDDNFQNLQVSSRTDRGVHAIKNTMHVDLRPRNRKAGPWNTKALHHGINHFLTQQGKSKALGAMNQTRILSVQNAPLTMKNVFYNGTQQNGPEEIDWCARFSATSRTYVYRILESDNTFAVPFEWDRSWRLENEKPLDVDAMNQAAQYLIGTHDVSSFRGPSCLRSSPIATMNHFSVTPHPYGFSAELGLSGIVSASSSSGSNERLILVKISGKSFVYRQVRNLVGCLVQVGRGKLNPMDVKRILETRDRRAAPAMAPASGLFLVDVEHGDFKI